MGQGREYKAQKDPVDWNSSPILSMESDGRTTKFMARTKEDSECKSVLKDSRDILFGETIIDEKLTAEQEDKGNEGRVRDVP